MDCGKKIYPQEGLNQFDDIIEKIKRTTVFSREAYINALDKNENLTEADIQMQLKKCDCKKKMITPGDRTEGT